MKDTELRQERDRELYSVYIRGLREQHFTNMHDAAEWVRHQPASKFYVSSKALLNYVGAIKNGSTPCKMHKQNERKMKMLYAMYQQFIAEHPNCDMAREHICELLVDSPAPMFFISHECARISLWKERNRQQEERERRIKQ